MQQNSSFIRSFVRREGRFTKAQRDALKHHWHNYGIELKHDHQQLKFDICYVKQQPLVLDIGFGNGESLIFLARQHPNLNFLGVEVYRPGIGNLLRNAFDAKLENIRVINMNVVDLLQRHIATNSFTAVLIWFADPWPKKRHHKRRLIQVPFLKLLVDKITQEGELYIATDWQPYAEKIQVAMQTSKLFSEVSSSSIIKQRPQTKFSRRGEKLGHEVFEQVYIKKI